MDQRRPSPRVAALRVELERTGAVALERFWHEVTDQGAPLIEPDGDGETFRLVTFLWRAEQALDNVVLLSEHLNGWWWDGFASSKLNHLYPKDDVSPESTEDVWSVVELPAASPQPYVAPRPGVLAGQIELHRLRSEILQNERRVWVYRPVGYSRHKQPYPGVVLLDGWYYTTAIPTATMIDNLVADARIPPCLAVMVHTRQDRGRELVPWARQTYDMTADPARTIAGGASLGGVAAGFAALEHPDLFGNVLCQSGAFWNGKAGIAEEEWLASEFARRDPIGVRFYLEAGLFENQRDAPEITILRATRHLRTVLEARGYPVRYSEYNGGHRSISWRGSLADGLIALMDEN